MFAFHRSFQYKFFFVTRKAYLADGGKYFNFAGEASRLPLAADVGCTGITAGAATSARFEGDTVLGVGAFFTGETGLCRKGDTWQVVTHVSHWLPSIGS